MVGTADAYHLSPKRGLTMTVGLTSLCTSCGEEGAQYEPFEDAVHVTVAIAKHGQRTAAALRLDTGHSSTERVVLIGRPAMFPLHDPGPEPWPLLHANFSTVRLAHDR